MRLTARGFIRIATATAAAVGAIPLFMFFSQDNLIFYPQPLAPGVPQLREGVEEVSISAADGTRLHGWFMQGSRNPAPVVVYFGGNAEEVSSLAGAVTRLPGWSLLLVNYRGYGRSEGKPGERELFADALALHDYASSRPDVDARRIVAMGRSLGSGVAVHLARERPVVGVVLVTPYDSVTAVAESNYPWLPVRWLLRHKFDSLARAGEAREPLLCLAAGRDRVIPPSHAARLFEAWGGPKQWLEFRAADHDSILAEPGYWTAIAAFLRER